MFALAENVDEYFDLIKLTFKTYFAIALETEQNT